jgi:cell division septation protein DedD
MNRINPYLVAAIVGGVVSVVIGTLGWRWIPNGFLFALSGSIAGIASCILASRLTRTVESPKPTAPETPKPTAPKPTAPKTTAPKTTKPKPKKPKPKTTAPKTDPTGTP